LPKFSTMGDVILGALFHKIKNNRKKTSNLFLKSNRFFSFNYELMNVRKIKILDFECILMNDLEQNQNQRNERSLD